METKMETKQKELREKSLDMVAEINKVPGFYPEALSETYTDERTGEEKTMLPLAYKKAWFRAKYPLGRIVTENLGYNKDSNLVEMKAYCYATNDPTEAPIGEGHVFTIVNEYEDDGIERAIADATLLAEGSAKSRALYEAGFGLQFYRDAEPEELERQMKKAEVSDTSLEEWQAQVENANITPVVEADDNNAFVDNSTTSVVLGTTEAPKRRTAIDIVADNNAILSDIKAKLTSGDVSISDVKEDFEKAVAGNKKQAQKNVVKEAIKKGELEFVEFKLEDFEKPKDDASTMTWDEALSVNCTHVIYKGQTLKDVYDSKPTLLPRLFQESEDDEERTAISFICKNDEMIREYCERNGKTEVLA